MSIDYSEIIEDLRNIGCQVRINDLDEGIEVKLSGRGWQKLDNTTEAIIKTKAREQGYGGKRKPSLGAMLDALVMHADENRYNPIKSYFQSLDGRYIPKASGPYHIPQLSTFFTSPETYSDGNNASIFGVWLFKWMVGAIAKLFTGERNPMLVIVGEQRTGKSFFINWLCPLKNHFNKGSINPDSKDAVLRLIDVFIWEVEELGATTRRSDVEALKSFITRPFVYERPPYGRYPIHKPVATSFFGTVNHDGAGFLTDPTGSTRFLSCTVEAINWDYTKLNIDDLWAEAYWFYKHMPYAADLSEHEKERQAQINAQFESRSPLIDVIEGFFDVTHDEADFMTNLAIKDIINLHYRMGNELAFWYDLNRVLTKFGLKRGRKILNDNRQYRGWFGIKPAQKGD